MPIRPVVQFPETAQAEWNIVANAARAEQDIKERLEHDTLVENEVAKMRRRHEATLIFQAELDAEETPTLEMTTLANFKANPVSAPADLIEGVLKQDGLCIMLGPSGSGKSTLALQMANSLMSGEDWLAQPTKPIMGGVGIMSYDMDAAMVLDWMNGYPSIDPAKVSVVNAYKRGNPLGVPALRSQIAAAWKQIGVEVVTVDSFSASFFGQDQNSAAETMAHYRDLKKFALHEVGARALVVIAHSSDSSPKKPRGSSVHHDVADSIVAVWSPKGPTGPRWVEMTKYRAARGQSQMDPRIITAPDDVTHLVDLDPAAMAMEGMHLPASVGAAAFMAMPDTNEEPETSGSNEDGEEDDL